MRPIFVAATRQHVGKTTVSLALMSGLKKRLDRVGFIKPVGQQHIPVTVPETGEQIRIDKDVQVMKEYFALDHVSYLHMSPVIIPRGYTSRYINGEVQHETQVRAITRAYDAIAAKSDIVLAEGTGHVGVGSIVEVSNARTASILGADVVLVANGGLGKAFDELEMNRQMFAQEGVAVRGVVLNKVIPEKVDEIRDKMGRLLRDRWGVPLLGVVPDKAYLGMPTLGDLESTLGGQLIAGERCRGIHYQPVDAFLVTTGLRRFLRRAFEHRGRTWTRPLFVTHSTRDDLLLGFLAHHQKMMTEQGGSISKPGEWSGAMVLSVGASAAFPDLEQHADDLEALPYLKQMAIDTDAPVIITPYGTIDALDSIKSYTPKQNIGDQARLQAAIDHYEPQIDFETLLKQA